MMKIDVNQPISSPLPPTDRPVRSSGGTIEAQRSANVTQSSRVQSGSDVTTQFSAQAREMGRLQNVVDSTADLRRSRVDGLRDAVAQGTYQVSPERIAQAMLAQATNKAR
jgi:negative regulator of flagellin synthesis FlgM